MDNKLRGPKFDFDCEEYRYNHRFAPFGSVSTPPPMHYQQFRVSILGKQISLRNFVFGAFVQQLI